MQRMDGPFFLILCGSEELIGVLRVDFWKTRIHKAIKNE
jgi:hypothetical protein